jgi:hypothetical protein
MAVVTTAMERPIRELRKRALRRESERRERAMDEIYKNPQGKVGMTSREA